MGKIVLLVSKEEMLHQAHNILQESRYKIEKMKVIRTEDTIVEARKAIAEGASIIIARGLQASLIKQYTDKTDFKEAPSGDRSGGVEKYVLRHVLF